MTYAPVNLPGRNSIATILDVVVAGLWSAIFLQGQRNLFVQPTAQVDLAAAKAAKRHGRSLLRIERLAAGWTSCRCHDARWIDA
jgi:hypothetical protein